ncbi:hypothetical protein KSS87_019293 [Heliosperma pusillum]|nr:hypothetical protein KSS87_019293 [Heliosperma pusillum]
MVQQGKSRWRMTMKPCKSSDDTQGASILQCRPSMYKEPHSLQKESGFGLVFVGKRKVEAVVRDSRKCN